MLHDFTFRDPEEILAGLAKGMSHGAGHDMNHAMGHDMGTMPENAMAGGAKPMADLNDVAYDAYLANDRTLEDPEIVTVERAGRVRLRIINAAASTNFLIDLGRLEGTLIAVDGRPIGPDSRWLSPNAPTSAWPFRTRQRPGRSWRCAKVTAHGPASSWQPGARPSTRSRAPAMPRSGRSIQAWVSWRRPKWGLKSCRPTGACRSPFRAT